MWDLLPNRITVTRRTAYVLPATPAAVTMALTRQPAREALLEVQLAGTTCTGTVYVQGIDAAGATNSEALAFAGAGYQTTRLRYASGVGFTTSGLADETAIPTVAARAVNGAGSPEPQAVAVVSGWPASVRSGMQSWSAKGAGHGAGEHGGCRVVIAYDETWAPHVGDVCEDEYGQRWEILAVPPRAGAALGTHWECIAQRREVDP